MFNLFNKNYLQNKKTLNVKKLVADIKDRYGLELLVLFGSYAKNCTWSESDLDLGFWSRKRLTSYQLENFIIDVARITGCRKVDLIDLYFDEEKRFNEMKEKGSKYGKDLSLIQYVIFNSGKVLYERKDNFFLEKKMLTQSNTRYLGKDIKSLIIHDKIDTIKNLLKKLDVLDNKYYAQLKNTNKNEQGILEYFQEADVSIMLKVIDCMVKLNRFLLTEKYNIIVTDRSQSFLDLLKTGIYNEKTKEQITEMVKVANLNNFLSLDYYYGPGWIVNGIRNGFKKEVNEYLAFVEKLK